MVEEILKIILIRNIKGKKLNKDDIRRICYIIIKRMKYEKMIRRIIFEKNSIEPGDIASFDGEDLIFYVENGNQSSWENYQKLKDDNIILDGGMISYYNFDTLNTIFHEFAHIRQDYLICRRFNNKEAEIYRICYDIVENIKRFYNDNYDIILTEVNAFNDGILKAFNIYKNAPIDIVSKNDKEIYAKMSLKKILDNYLVDDNEIKSSSEILLESLKYYEYSLDAINVEKLKSLIYHNNFVLYDRLKIGLPITEKEYHHLQILYDNISNNYNFVKKIRR